LPNERAAPSPGKRYTIVERHSVYKSLTIPGFSRESPVKTG